MSTRILVPQEYVTSDEAQVVALYRQMLDGWNTHDSAAMAAPFAEDANVIGFDGSQMNGRADIETTMTSIFADHVTAAYVAIVREVRFISPDAAILRAVVGMIPPGQTDLNAANAIQSLVAAKVDDVWKIALFQNTPAQFHGRPDLSEQLTNELRRLLM